MNTFVVQVYIPPSSYIKLGSYPTKKVYRLFISVLRLSAGNRNNVGFAWSLDLYLPKESMPMINTFLNSIPIHISIKPGYFCHFDNILKTIYAEIL